MQGTILRRATDYIHQLEQANRFITFQNHQLIMRVRELETKLQETGVVYQRYHMGHFDKIVPHGL